MRKLAFTLFPLLVLAAASQRPDHKAAQKAPDSLQSRILFRETSANAGVTGMTTCGTKEKTAIVEVNGSGACWFDYNNDGLLDLFVVNGSTLEELRTHGSTPHSGAASYLYKNNGDRTFTDVAGMAGVSGHAWGTGCAAADFDNDGWVDLFVSNVGECFLYKNRGDGTFAEIGKKAGVNGKFSWYTGAAFGDYDADGFLDLYVAAYLDPAQMLKEQAGCTWKGLKVYCGPPGMRGAPDVLYRNNGDGTFGDVTRQAGVEDSSLLFGFTASFDDFDNDGKLDIVVANDRGRNYLYHNIGGGKFKEVGEIWGLAYPIEGIAQANMGFAIGDYDRNGTMDVFVTTFSDEHYTLFKNAGNQTFMDVSTEAGVSLPTLPFLGWGTFFADLDNDGWLDLFNVNGHVYPQVDQVTGFKEGFAQRPLIFRQSGPGRFTEFGKNAGLDSVRNYSSRGATYADFDNDGDLDILYTNLGGPPTLLENVSSPLSNWITIKVVGTQSNRDGIGARLKLTSGDLIQYATVRSGESYLSGNDPRTHFGLGTRKMIDELEIRWPSGQIDKIPSVGINQLVTAQEKKGIIRSSKPILRDAGPS